MNNTELKNDVLRLSGANSIDYVEADIEANIEMEYYKLQELLRGGQRIKWNPNSTLAIQSEIDVNTHEILTDDRNAHINSVEVKVGEGSWYQLKRTDEVSFSKYGEGSITEARARVANPKYFIQSNKGISIFPTDGEYDCRIHYESNEDISWGSSNEIELVKFAQRLVTLKAALLYPHISDDRKNRLENEYADLYRVFLKHIAKGGKVIQMKFKQGTYQ